MRVGAVLTSAVRAWVHSTLLNSSYTQPLTADRVFQQGSILTSQRVKPYLVHHFGNQTDEGMSDEDNFQPSRQFLQIYMHVDQGDYGPIDEIQPQVKLAMSTLSGRPVQLAGVHYLETSQDLQDEVLQTYFRYMRYQLILSR